MPSEQLDMAAVSMLLSLSLSSVRISMKSTDRESQSANNDAGTKHILDVQQMYKKNSRTPH